MKPPAPARPPLIVLGSARLPKSIGGEEPSAVLIELTVDSADGRVVDVAATIALPGYVSLLRTLVIGRRLDEVEGAAQELNAYLRGPLLKPTIAALAKAATYGTSSEEALLGAAT